MIRVRLFLLLGLAIALTVFTSPAEAARKKGKKSGGEHGHRGVVEGVNHQTGVFTIKASHHHHKNSTANKGMARRGKGKGIGRKGKGMMMAKNRGAGNGGQMMFQVHRGTKFQGGSFKGLRKGEHVVVMSQGQRADSVTIGGKAKGKPKRRKKANV